MAYKTLETDKEILYWLNQRKQQTIKGLTVPISDIPHGKRDDLTGGGLLFEGYPVASIFFYDQNANGITSTAKEEHKVGALIYMKMGETILWVKSGHEALLTQIKHDWRLSSVKVWV